MIAAASSKWENPLILVGCGNMGYALLRSWLKSSIVEPGNVHVVEPVDSLRDRAASLGVNTHEASETLPAKADLVVIALKPQVLQAELSTYRSFSGQALFVSIAAGVPTEVLELLLGSPRIVRAMPNTPTAIGKGSTIVFAASTVSKSDLDKMVSLFQAGGAVHKVAQEVLMDAATAISGSGPAYIFHLLECLTDAARQLGLPETIASNLARETVYGAAALAIESPDAPAELRRQVTSPNGTTAAGLAELMHENALSSLIARTTKAAFDRSKELAAPAQEHQRERD
ncbi:pyrroline-5-carboxylate reductase [Sinorhizobium sp. 7-81]|uniref:pyrroline-5-carboxylate reductase n=1 Tax=Sinorhizobium sp. 8-89 TaxID=3049089 RepID=UPI0024C20F9B|nr:pyrroline-5-carboxylate reductase [Sinorhizobium sp. 8-89]MDK1494297.1 pyrroline-5-carboxylate reductase [Sinorhizobium sp. 8-89]